MNFQFKKEKKLSKFSNFQRGFTLIELLLSIAIIATVSVVGFVGFFNYRNMQNLKLSANELATVIRDTQKKSVTQQDGKRWGIRFENGNDGNQRFSVFNGSAFGVGSTTQSILIRRGVSFGSPFTSSAYDMLFAPITGFPLEGKIITLFHSGAEKNTVADIVVNILGKTTLRMENGLVGYWHFDEEEGIIAYDSSGKNNHGTLSENAPLQVFDNCISDNCLNFQDGSFVSMSPSSDFLFENDFTISFWIQTGESEANMTALVIGNEGHGDNLNFLFNDENSGKGINFFWKGKKDGDSSIRGGNLFEYTNGLKHFITLRRLDDKLELFIDSNSIDREGFQFDTTMGSTVNNMLIGIDANFENRWRGIIDEVRIYNRGLSADEIKTIYEDLK